MIRLQILILSVFLLFFTQLFANPINEADALLLATTFHQMRNPIGLRSTVALKLVYNGSNTMLRSITDPAFFVYNIGENQGFVIISGDDATKTILGYEDEGSFQTDSMPENLKYWLDFYQKEIEAVRDASVKATETTTEQLASVATGTTTVAPLLGGIKWNQTDPYNLLCPWDTGAGSHTLAGCVAIAMAQIMKYHNWPVTGIGTHTYTDATYGAQTVNFGTTNYDWNNMAGAYSTSATTAQKIAVSTLVYHCGVAANMAYSLTGSSSNIGKAAEAFVSHFGYDTEIQKYDRPYYTMNEWNSLIKTELDNSRPVYYSASSDDGGHAFVCDGYDSNNLFHINWGWGGQSNGYFELSSLSTANPGLVGATPEYTYYQSILKGIRKDDGINKVSNQMMVYNIGLSSSVKSVPKLTTSFDLTFGFGNMGINTANVRWGIGFVKEGSSTLTKLVENSSSTYTSFPSGSYYPTKTLTLGNITAMITPGQYRLYPIYLPKDSTNWSIMRGTSTLNNCMIVTVASSSGPATIVPALEALSLTLTMPPQPLTNLYTNKSVNVDLTIQNNGKEFYSRVGLCLISTTDPGDQTYICESKVLCAAGETKTFHLTGPVTNLPGNYYLQAQFDSTNSDSKMNYKVFGPTVNNSKVVAVLPTPGTPALKLNSPISMANGAIITKNDIVNLSVSLTNTGGYYDSRLIAFIFPKNGGTSLTYLAPKYVYIDSLETKDVTLTGTVNLGSGDYFFSIYQFWNDNWIQLLPDEMSDLNFNVTNETAERTPKNEPQSLYIYQNGTKMMIVTNLVVRESKCFDLSGRLVRNLGSEKALYIGDLSPGVYLMHIQTNGKNYVERFLKK